MLNLPPLHRFALATTAGEEREKARQFRHAMTRSPDPSAIDTVESGRSIGRQRLLARESSPG